VSLDLAYLSRAKGIRNFDPLIFPPDSSAPVAPADFGSSQKECVEIPRAARESLLTANSGTSELMQPLYADGARVS